MLMREILIRVAPTIGPKREGVYLLARKRKTGGAIMVEQIYDLFGMREESCKDVERKNWYARGSILRDMQSKIYCV
jgi:hypothetical protein